MLKAVDICKSYETTKVLKGLSFQAELGQFIALYGRSGAGKSTLLHILSGIEFAESGEVTIKDFNMSESDVESAAAFRLKNIGIVFQFFNLLPTLTIEQNIKLPAELLGRNADEHFEHLTKALRINDKHKLFPYQVSGGERQRAAIARAMINQPCLVLADEPTGNLDSETASNTLELIKEVTSNKSVTVICATHDEKTASYADRILQIQDGKLS